jgi:polyadenylate-binding protein
LDVSDEELRELFGKYGSITSCLITKDNTGVSRGFGFVNFEKHEDAQRAVDELHGNDFHGQNLYVSRAQKKSEREEELRRQYEDAKMEKLNKYQGVNLYVKNLDDDVDDDQLREIFSVYGVITSAKIMRSETNESRGFGFVCFTSPEEATRAVTEINGRIIGTKPIYVAIAQRKEDRRSQMAQLFQLKQRMNPNPVPMYAPNMYGPPSMIAARPVYSAMPFPGQAYPVMPRPAPPMPVQARPAPPMPVAEPALHPLNAKDLASFPAEVQKQMLGERLYPIM